MTVVVCPRCGGPADTESGEHACVPATRVTARVDSLDGLRGILAVVVAFSHGTADLFPALNGGSTEHLGIEPLLLKSPFAALLAADLAVRIFFVHSGFVLALKYFRSRDGRWPTAMLVRRPLRLGFPVFATVLISWLMVQLISPRPGALAAATGGAVTHLYDLSTRLPTAVFDAVVGTMYLGREHVPGAWWSMPIELYGSLALLGTLICWGRLSRVGRRVLLGCYVGALAAVGVFHPEMPGRALVTVGQASLRMFLFSFCFALGAGLAWLWARDPRLLSTSARRHRLAAVALVAGALLVGVFPSALRLIPGENETVLQLSFMVAAFGVLVGLLSWPAMMRRLERPVFAWLGRISFSVYLIHVVVQQTIMARLFLALRSSGVAYNAAAFIALAIQFVVVFVLADLLARTVDRLAMSWGKGWVYERLGLATRSGGAADGGASPSLAV